MTNHYKGFVGLLLLMGGISGAAFAGNNKISVQGTLKTSTGTVLTGSYSVTFRVYANLSDPVGSALWSESQTVTASSGAFNVTLGTSTNLDTLSFKTPYYLGMQVAGDASELSPRQLLGAAPYALGSLGDFNVGKNLTVTSSATVPMVIVSTLAAVSSATITNISSQRITSPSVIVSTLTAVSSATIANLSVTNLSGVALGKVRQVVQGTSSANFSTTSSAFQTTNLSASITPTSSSSKILVIASGALRSAQDVDGYATLSRGGTNLGGSNGLTRVRGYAALTCVPVTLSYLDSPSTTSATTYAVQVKSNGVNAVEWPTEVTSLVQSIVLIEIGQ